jgi:methionyl-tRNA formyltransferase
MEKARIVFMGTPQFAVPSLIAAAQWGHVVAVVTQPDKPKGRGNTLAAPPVKLAALERDLPVRQPAKIRGTGFSEELRALAPDICVVAAYGKILPPDVLEVPRLGCVNVHGSLLPRFRGAAPIQWAIAAGDERTGITLMQMDEGMDTGPILARAEVRIEPRETSASLYDKLAELGADLLRRSLPALFEGKLPAIPQPADGVVYAPMIRKEDGALDFQKSARELERRVRAFYPWPGAFVRMGAARVKVLQAEFKAGAGAPGSVLSAGAEGLEVACGGGSLLVTQVQPEGKRAMTAAEFLSGRRLELGSFPFTVPQ